MPVLLPKFQWGGVKIVNRYPERNPSLDSQILLYDLRSGKNLALLDGNWITAMRTGCVAAHSMNLFSKPDFKTLGYIGLGNAARASLEIFLALHPEREIKIKLLKYKNQHELFASRFSHEKYSNVYFEYVDTYKDVIKNTDIVVEAATYLDKDICEFEYIDEGALVIPIHTRGFTQFDYLFDKIFGDDTGHIRGFKNFDKYKSFAEVSDVVNGKVVGRSNNREKIIVYNIGIAIYDIFFAGKLYERMSQNSPEVFLNPPTEKFWI